MDLNRPIPGPDPGACPKCGFWIRAGMNHDCKLEEREFNKFITYCLNCFDQLEECKHGE